jgi:hypothetical protein
VILIGIDGCRTGWAVASSLADCSRLAVAPLHHFHHPEVVAINVEIDMSDEGRWTPRQPQVELEAKACEVLRTLLRGTESRRADLRDDGVTAAELQIYVNGQFVNAQRYETRTQAILQAESIRDALVATGWT